MALFITDISISINLHWVNWWINEQDVHLDFLEWKFGNIDSIDQIHKSKNAPVPYPTMHHSEQKCAHFYSKWCIVGYGTGAFWDLWDQSISLKFVSKGPIINSLGPSDAIWHWRTWSTLVQVIACCLTAPSHYLNQCWLIISKVLWHSSEDNIIDMKIPISKARLKITFLKSH